MMRRIAMQRLGLPPSAVTLATLLGLLAFARVLGFEFVYDDRWTIIDNQWLAKSLVELWALLASGEAVTKHVPDATRPLMVLVHALERQVFGLAPWGYHLVSLLLYAACSALAARLALVLTRRRYVALFAGCFFALAPLHAEPVAAVNYREDLLAALGVLGALSLWFTSPALGRGEGARRERPLRAVATAALLALGLCGKESGLAFVPLAAAIYWLVPWARQAARRNRLALYLLGAVLLAWLAWRAPLSRGGEDLPLAPERPLAQLLLRTARFEVLSLVHALAPVGYAPDHWRQPDASFSWVIPALSLLVVVATFRHLRGMRPATLGVALALAAPLAACPLLRPINEFADRYWFVSVLGGGLVWGVSLERLLVWRGLSRFRAYLPLVCLLLVVPTWRATSLWRDERSLWTAAVALTPGSPRAWAGLSRVQRLAGERDAADASLLRALGADADYGPALVTEIYNDLAFGRLELAREHLRALEAKGLGREGGVGTAKRCAALIEPDAAARCIGR